MDKGKKFRVARVVFIIYLIVKSNFLGFINTHTSSIAGLPINVLIDFLVLLTVLTIGKIRLDGRRKYFLFVYICLILIYFIYSYFTTQSSIQGRLPRLSDHLTLVVAVLITQEVDLGFAKKGIQIILLLSAIVFLAHNVMQVSIGQYRIEAGTMDSLKFELAFFVFLFSAFLLGSRKDVRFSFVFIVFTLAIFASGFRSVLVGMMLLLSFYYWKRLEAILRTLIVFIIFFITPSVFNGVLNDEAITSRLSVNLSRFQLFMERPFFGYGFISRESELHNMFLSKSISRFDSTVNVVDAGFLDIILRFGVLGGIIYLLVLKNIIWGTNQPRLEVVTGVLLINITLSVLTFGFGLFALGIYTGLLMLASKQYHTRPK